MIVRMVGSNTVAQMASSPTPRSSAKQQPRWSPSRRFQSLRYPQGGDGDAVGSADAAAGSPEAGGADAVSPPQPVIRAPTTSVPTTPGPMRSMINFPLCVRQSRCSAALCAGRCRGVRSACRATPAATLPAHDCDGRQRRGAGRDTGDPREHVAGAAKAEAADPARVMAAQHLDEPGKKRGADPESAPRCQVRSDARTRRNARGGTDYRPPRSMGRGRDPRHALTRRASCPCAPLPR